MRFDGPKFLVFDVFQIGLGARLTMPLSLLPKKYIGIAQQVMQILATSSVRCKCNGPLCSSQRGMKDWASRRKTCLKKLTATKASVLAFCMVSKIYGIVPEEAKGPAMWKHKPATTIFQTLALAWYN